LRLADLDYELPAARIAQRPAARREDARLMVLQRTAGAALLHRTIADLPELLPAGGVLVVNDTRVGKARLRGKKTTGGAAELLLVRREADGTFRALGRAGKALRAGVRIDVAPDLAAGIEGRDEEGLLIVRLEAAGGDVEGAIERHGEVPLPPYVRRRPDEADALRYQTVFARSPGAVAAPTAGLHLTEELLDRTRARGVAVHSVTLHVGLGTFAPVTVDDLDQHPMHAERYVVPPETARAVDAARAEGRPVIAVGTTVVRTLESACAATGRITPGPGETRLLLQPGARLRAVDALLTNFHVPRSTLLALVMAFAGRERILAAYAEAIRLGYRFFSYGDAMLLTHADLPASAGGLAPPERAGGSPGGQQAPPTRR
jgi:S-adenosylmethionine:tRNA ribosyltransferase-isomerase